MITSQESASAEAQKALEAYPAAEDGQQRWLIWFEAVSENTDEDALRVDVRVGVRTEVDGVNRYRLSGELRKRSVEGWGFDSYHYEGESEVASTRMSAKGVIAQSDIVWNASQLIRYNSRLPLVVYMPAHLHLSYRILAPVTEYNSVSVG